MSLTDDIRSRVDAFLADHDLCTLYRGYHWGRDRWVDGFPDMRRLERDLSTHAKQGFLAASDVMDVAEWGRLRNKKRVHCPARFAVSLYTVGDPADDPRPSASASITTLRETISGMGPTYLSKILMFSQPRFYGALDTRLVRVFGVGDSDGQRPTWLSLAVKDYGSGWHIPQTQPAWPHEYCTWLEILHHIASVCNENGLHCPHPQGYVDEGLREKGVWIVADVETALFSFASQELE